MRTEEEQEALLFDAVVGQKSFSEVLAFMRELPPMSEAVRKASAAYAMVLVARAHAQPASNFYEGREALNELSRAKCELDVATGQAFGIAEVTSTILLEAQRAFDEAIVPCTEWASTEEIHQVVLGAAKRALAPNPSIERTCPGEPGHAAHVER